MAMIVVDAESHTARACAVLMNLLSNGRIRWQTTWLVKPGEPVWYLRP